MHLKVGDKEAPNYEVIDLDTGNPIRYCQWANDETGEYCIVVTNEDGSIKDKDGEIMMGIKKGNIKLQKK